jgi:hypothetical protein
MNIPLELSLEQQFSLRTYADQVKGLDQEQAQQLLLQVVRQLMIKENVIRHLVKESF